jgi:hypothetical protein
MSWYAMIYDFVDSDQYSLKIDLALQSLYASFEKISSAHISFDLIFI